MVASGTAPSTSPPSSAASTPPPRPAGASGSGTASSASESPAQAGTHRPHSRGKGGIRRLLQSAFRLLEIQYRLMLMQAKSAILRIALFAGLFGAAAVLGLLAIIFLYIGVFRVLTDVAGLRPVWAFLIFGGGNLLVALILIGVGIKMLSKNDDSGADKPRKEDA